MSFGLPADWLPAMRELHRRFKSPCHIISFHPEAAFGLTPMALVEREPILKNINFQLSPTHFQVLRLYGNAGMVSHPNSTISFCHQSPYHSSFIFTVKTFNRMKHHSKVWFIVFPTRVIKYLFSTSN